MEDGYIPLEMFVERHSMTLSAQCAECGSTIYHD